MMSDPQKTVFISYRRSASAFIARAIYEHLKHNGYDVFMDVESIDSGKFDTIILNQIAARAHFLIILTDGSLERCVEEGDWLRREIESAIDLRRNIVPIAINNFDFNVNQTYLVGKLTQLPSFNTLHLPHTYFEEAMERLRVRYLKQPNYGTLRPTPIQEESVVQDMIEKADDDPIPTSGGLSTDDYFARGLAHYEDGNYEAALNDFSEIIFLDPHNANAYAYRGRTYWVLGNHDQVIADCNQALVLDDENVVALNYLGSVYLELNNLDNAILNYTRAIRIKPDYALAYYNRGIARKTQGDIDGALQDYNEAIQLDATNAHVYNNRGNVRKAQGDLDEAIADYTEAIRLQPESVSGYYNRGIARKTQGNIDGALADYNDVIRIQPDFVDAFINRGILYETKFKENEKALADYQHYLDSGGVRRTEVEQWIAQLGQK